LISRCSGTFFDWAKHDPRTWVYDEDKEFDPDQPRDEQGRWTADGDGVGGSTTTPAQRALDIRDQQDENQRQINATWRERADARRELENAERMVTDSNERYAEIQINAAEQGRELPDSVRSAFEDEIARNEGIRDAALAKIDAANAKADELMAKGNELLRQQDELTREVREEAQTRFREEYSSERLTAKREAMIAETDRRTAALDQRHEAATKTFEAVGSNYMDAANQQAAAYRTYDAAMDRLDSFNRDLASGRFPEEAVREAITRAEADVREARAEVDAVNERIQPSVRALSEADSAFRLELDRIATDRRQMNEDIREKYVNAPEGPAQINLRTNDYTAANMPSNWKDGAQVVGQIIGQGAVTDRFAPNIREMERDDPWYASGRSYHNSGVITNGGWVTMHPGDRSTSTVVHELGHAVEAAMNGSSERIWQHIDSRTEGEQAVSLRDHTGKNFDVNEMSKVDRFADPYMGKTDYGRTASEFLSMSLQKMYEDPVGFARADPESYDFVQQLLAEARANDGSLPML
jgi:hypothetical protein